jgi:hypothetical protein
MYRVRLAIHVPNVPDCCDHTTADWSVGNLDGTNQYVCMAGPAVAEVVWRDMGT